MSNINIKYVQLKVGKVKSDKLLQLTGNTRAFFGYSALPVAFSSKQLDDISKGYAHTSNQVFPMPAIPIVKGNQVMVVPVTVDAISSFNYDDGKIPANLLKLSAIVSQANAVNKIKLPNIVSFDASLKMAPVVTDSLGRQYHTCSKVHVLYGHDIIEAQAIAMSTTIPLPEETLDKAKSYLKLRLKDKEPSTTFIYLKDRFVDIYE